jgi:type IX secretion system PorP/SprF family membrane protein
MSLNKKVFLFLMGSAMSNSIFSQDFTFSQFYEMPLLRNPALAGNYKGSIRVLSAYRSQWASVTVPFETKALSTEMKFPVGNNSDFLSVGVQLIQDQAGDSKLSRTHIEPVINFHKSFDDAYSYLSFALIGGVVQSQFDPTRLTFDDQFVGGHFNSLNPTQSVLTKTSLSYIDGGAGISFSSALDDGYFNYYFGAAGYHLLKPNVSFFDYNSIILKQRYVINGGVSIPSGDYDNACFYGDYIFQGGSKQFLAGILFSHLLYQDEIEDLNNKVSIHVGGAYRWADAFIPIVKIEMKKLFIGVSYDVNISKLRTASQYRGGFEVTASFKSFLNSQTYFGGSGGRNGGLSNGMSPNGMKCPTGF